MAAVSRARQQDLGQVVVVGAIGVEVARAYVVPLDGAFRVSLTVRPAERATLLADPAQAAIHDALAAVTPVRPGGR